jgi:hypothetical protein
MDPYQTCMAMSSCLPALGACHPAATSRVPATNRASKWLNAGHPAVGSSWQAPPNRSKANSASGPVPAVGLQLGSRFSSWSSETGGQVAGGGF